jgi:DNA gyrase/topoisomerase IV subunit B
LIHSKGFRNIYYYVDEKGNKHPAGYGRVYFENGQCKEYVVEDLPNGIPAGKHPGTTVSYKSSEKYMHTTEHDIPRICDLCNNIAYQTPGFTFNFIVDGKVHTFRHLGGMKEQMKDFINNKRLNCLFEPIEFQGDEPTFDYHIMFTYNPINSGDSNIISYVNGNTTPGHGFHVSSFKKGLGLALKEPMYVCDKSIENNTVVLATNDELYMKTLQATDFNWILYENPPQEFRAKARIRYRQEEQWATIRVIDNKNVSIEFDESQRAIAKGQAVVLYLDNIVVGGGTII